MDSSRVCSVNAGVSASAFLLLLFDSGKLWVEAKSAAATWQRLGISFLNSPTPRMVAMWCH